MRDFRATKHLFLRIRGMNAEQPVFFWTARFLILIRCNSTRACSSFVKKKRDLKLKYVFRSVSDFARSSFCVAV